MRARTRVVIRNAARDDLPALCALFARANDAPYSLETVAEEKCFGDGIAGAPVVRVFERDGRLAGAAVSCGKWLRILIVDRDARRQGIGSALVADARPQVIAAEPGNYFTPGVSDEGSRAFFRGRGFVEKAWTWNLEVVLSAECSVLYEDDQHSALSTQHQVCTQHSAPSTVPRVLDFIEREFGRIWRFEAARAPENIRIAEVDGEIAGFVVHEANNRGLGSFGPTGVAKAMRGRGIGRALLLASLADLRLLGYERAVIPWTDAIDFYRKSCGAEPAHRFVSFGLDSAP